MAAGNEVRLHVLGSSSAVPRPGRANSGYLLRSAGGAVAIDFGTGVFSRLRELMNPADLEAIIISHMHADHFFDLVPLRYALRYEMPRPEPLPVYLPPGGGAAVREVVRPLKSDGEFFSGIFDLREYAPDDALAVADCRFTFARTMHYIPAYAMRAETPDGVLVFSADTAPCRELEAIAHDADLFLCEAGLGADGNESGQRGHMNAREAGEIAARAGARHIVLTHYNAGAPPSSLQAAAASVYDGRITVADDGSEFPLGSP